MGPPDRSARRGARRTALVLAAHGSREDPLSAALARGQAERVRALGLFDEVAVAFHRGEPPFREVLDRLEAEVVTVVPLLTSAGYYGRVVLPRELKRNRRFGEVEVRVSEPVGTHPGMAGIVGRRAAELAAARGLDPRRSSLAVVGHGTPRHAESRRSTEEIVRVLASRGGFAQVVAAFLDERPRVEEILASCERPDVIVVPFLIAGGTHATRDVPRRLGLDVPEGTEPPFFGASGGRSIACDAPVGGDPGILEIILDLALPGRPPRMPVGSVVLVGAGPGDPGLLTVRGLEALRSADVVVHDRLVGSEILREARTGSEVVDAGKRCGRQGMSQEEIHALLADRARRGLRVVRLKGGDPFVFGRGHEELEACRAAGIPCEAVPGVTSAIAVPAAAGIPVTLRGSSRSFAVVTAHRAGGGLDRSALEAVAAADTVVILMGRSSLAEALDVLVASGRDPSTPAAIVENGTLPAQRTVGGTLGDLARRAEAAGLEAPCVAVVGDVARCALEFLFPRDAAAVSSPEGRSSPADGRGWRSWQSLSQNPLHSARASTRTKGTRRPQPGWGSGIGS